MMPQKGKEREKAFPPLLHPLPSWMWSAMQESQETWVQPLGQDNSLEEEMATHSNILAWRIPWTEEPGGLQTMWSQSQI